MNKMKTVNLIPENHIYLRKLAFINKTTIQSETNKIISKKRKEK